MHPSSWLVIVNNWKTDWSSKISAFLNVAIVMFSITCTWVCKTNSYNRQCDCYRAFYYAPLDVLQQENNNYGTTSTCWVVVHTFAKTCISSDEGYDELIKQKQKFCSYFFPHHLRSQRLNLGGLWSISLLLGLSRGHVNQDLNWENVWQKTPSWHPQMPHHGINKCPHSTQTKHLYLSRNKFVTIARRRWD